ncbi:MAG: DegT/DnrJ/EryC1/StrS family aminotransferase [Armatimonadota bacterium]
MYLQSFYRQHFGYNEGDYPVTESLSYVSLALPFSSDTTESQVDQVCNALIEILGK